MDNTNNTNEIKYIPMYKSYIDAVAQLNNEDRLAIYEAIFTYGFTGVEPTFENPYLAMGWNLVKPNLINNINNAIKNQENGKKGGRPKKSNDAVEPSKPSTENKAPKATISTQLIVEDQVKEIVSEIEVKELTRQEEAMIELKELLQEPYYMKGDLERKLITILGSTFNKFEFDAIVKQISKDRISSEQIEEFLETKQKELVIN